MMEQILPPGVQDGKEADFRSKVLRIGGNEAQRLGDSTKKNVVEDLFVVQGNGGDGFGEREDHMEIRSIC
jgi:N-methylhydantoinase B/oxoprolinase/acetone carboxylase alpha subunit